MKLHRAKVVNFRLLKDAELVLEDQTTLVVGRNNSGKTSLAEIIRRFTSRKHPDFYLQDFSVGSHDDFCKALRAKNEGGDEATIRSFLPYIELRLYFRYDPSQPQLGPLREFVIDVNMECNEALVVMRFEAADGVINQLFQDLPTGELDIGGRKAFFREMAERIPKQYRVNVWAEDPNDPSNRRPSSRDAIMALLMTGFINAQRGLDDITTKESDILAKVLEGLFRIASQDTADEPERTIALKLEEAVREIRDSIDGNFRALLEKLLPTLQVLGYPGLGGSKLTTETSLDVTRLLSNHTKVRYEGRDGVLLPETYNGLGMRNLVFIFLQIVSFYRDFRAQGEAPGVQLVFIEEPEAHLHPQMQEVFIRQLGAAVDRLNKEHKEAPPWPVQFLVSTHSSHVANEANFETIRYFLPQPIDSTGTHWKTDVKDLRQGLSSVAKQDKTFLHQYLTLTRCDLFFADKAILIEGTSERLILPIMISKVDKEAQQEGPQLGSQYVTIMEVGGAYAHKFFDLLNFLELQSLVITDLDPVSEPGGERCLVHEAKATSNACLNSWFGDKAVSAPKDLILAPDSDRNKGGLRLAFQVPETAGGPCGRTFEDAFLLANVEKFGVTGETADDLAKDARQKAESFKKSEFALRYSISDTEWKTPRYISEGLKWLAEGRVMPTPGLNNPEETAATAASAATQALDA